MARYSYKATKRDDKVSTRDLQYEYDWVTLGFSVEGLAGDDELVSSFVGRNGVDLIDGGKGNDSMSIYPSYLTPLPLTNSVFFFGDFGTDTVNLPDGDFFTSNFSIDENSLIEFTVYGKGREDTQVKVSPTVEIIILEGLLYLTEDIWNGRIRAVDFDEAYARAYNENSDWSVKGLDTYSEYYSPEPTPAPTPNPTSSDPIIGTAGKDKLKAKGRSIEIYGMGGNDKIIGSNGDDILDGGSGNDKIKGRKGADIYILSPGKDKFQGFKIKEGDYIQIDSSIDFKISGSRKLSKIKHDMGVTTIKKVSPTDLETVIEVV